MRRIRVAVLFAENGNIEAARRHLARGARREFPRKLCVSTAPRRGCSRASRAIDEADGGLLMHRSRSSPEIRIFSTRAGMLAVKLDRLDILERDMRGHPGRANRTTQTPSTPWGIPSPIVPIDMKKPMRLSSAHSSSSLKITTSSIPWGGFFTGLGRHRQALVQLRRAMSINPDPEIAAHTRRGALGAGEQGRGARSVEHCARVGAGTTSGCST